WGRDRGQPFSPRRKHHRAHHPFPGTQREKTGGTEGHNPRTIEGHCALGPDHRASQVTMTTSAALSLNLKLQVLEVRRREEVAAAVRAARNSQADALNGFSSPIFASLHRDVIAFSAEYRLPAIYQWKEHVEAGGLVSYGPGLAVIWRQSAVIVAKVLKGVKPADLPVEQPTKFDLALNLGTAKSLELTIPPSVLLRADEV